MDHTPKQTLAPALPGIMVKIIEQNCSDTTFLTIEALRDLVLEYTKQTLGELPKNFDKQALYNRVRYSLATAQDIDPKVKIKHHLTQRKTTLIKIYYA
jgi:hypothetical protein